MVYLIRQDITTSNRDKMLISWFNMKSQGLQSTHIDQTPLLLYSIWVNIIQPIWKH